MAKKAATNTAEQPEVQKSGKEAVAGLIAKINNHYGNKVIDLGSNMEEELEITFIPSKSFKLNQALCGGWARGRIIEIFGPQQSGKTTECYETVGLDMQNNPEGFWMWFETEYSFDSGAARNYGMEMNRLLLTNINDNGAEAGLDIVESVIRTGGPNLRGVIINSVAGLTPKAEFDGLMSKQDMGTMAKMMSKFMRKIIAIAGKRKVPVIFINQIRDKISLFGGTTTPGGRALAFYSSQRYERRVEKIDQADGVSANDYLKMHIKVVKNRLARKNPYVTTSLFARYGAGTDVAMEVLELAVAQGLIEKKAGGNYRYMTIAGEELKWRGNASLLDHFSQHPELIAEVSTLINAKDITVSSLSDEDMQALEKYNRETDEIQSIADSEAAEEMTENEAQ